MENVQYIPNSCPLIWLLNFNSAMGDNDERRARFILLILDFIFPTKSSEQKKKINK